MLFEWDESKRRSNLAKHHIDFQDALRIFDGPVFEKATRSRGEDRILAIGLLGDIEVVVAYAIRGKRRRIISARRAHRMLNRTRKGKTTQTTSRTRSKGATDFKRLRALRDSEIDFSDIPKLGKSFWATAKLTLPEPKDRLTIRVDHDVVQWLKRHGKGYQTRINAILRSYMEAQTDDGR
jgi:uncharacterized DUF497 family protein/uncharacterized protein (DUF4415 family)